jgi:hypothetical protein
MDSSKNIFSDSAVRISIVGVLAILALFLFAKTWSTVEEMGHVKIGETPTISVSGTGKASSPPINPRSLTLLKKRIQRTSQKFLEVDSAFSNQIGSNIRMPFAKGGHAGVRPARSTLAWAEIKAELKT